MADWLRYSNQGATRNQPLNPRLVNALSFLPDLGVQMEVFSGGQDATGPHRTGSHRHDHGNAGDVFFSSGGRRLNWANENDRSIFQEIVRRGKAAGVTGFGAGEGYMQPGSMHLGFGSPSVWGAGGSGANAPGWLRSAYGAGGGGGGGGGPAPSTQTAMLQQPANAAGVGTMAPPPLAGLFGANDQPGGGLGAPALMFAQQQMAQRQQKADEEEAALAQRKALLDTSLASLYG